MALKPDYTSRDRDSSLTRSILSLRSKFPDWSDEQLASFGNLILSEIADKIDSVSFYSDRRTKQSRLQTATLRRPVLQHAAFLGYTPKGASAAEAQVLVVLDAIPSTPIDIGPTTIFFSTNGTTPVEFRPTEYFTVDAGIDPPQFFVDVENAELVTDLFVSDGNPSQPFTMRQGPYIQDSAIVSAGGEPFDVKTSLNKSDDDDAHVTGSLTADDKLALRFGDGANGKIPVGQIACSYKFGGGRIGLVEENTIKVPSSTSLRTRGGEIITIVSVTNPAKSQNGDDRESINSIKERASRSRQTASDRTVAPVDYINNAETVAGVERAFLATHRNAALSPNQAILMIVPTGGGQPTDTLAARVLREVTIEKPGNPLTLVSVRGPTYLTVNINATVHLTAGSTEDSTRKAIQSSLDTFFSPQDPVTRTTNKQVLFGSEYVDNGQEASIPYHVLLAAFQNIGSVFKVSEGESDFLVNGNHNDLDIGSYEFPELGTITLVNAATGLPF